MKGIIRKTSILGVLLLLGTSLFAQNKDSVLKTSRNYTRGWYIGAQAGMPMAEADFSSFGADKFRPGWSAGIHAGYRFTPVWSLEMTANWGQQFPAERVETVGAGINRTAANNDEARHAATIEITEQR